MTLSNEERTKLFSKIKENWPEPQVCPICRSSNFDGGDTVFELREWDPKGQEYKFIPLFHIKCTGCGNLIFFSAISYDLLKQSPQPSTLPPQNIPAVDVLKMTTDQFRMHLQQPFVNPMAVKEMLKTFVEKVKYEITRIEAYLDNTRSQSTNILVVASLISLLTLQTNTQGLLHKYLMWVAPYFILSLLCYAVAVRRTTGRHTDPSSRLPGSEEEILLLHIEAQAVLNMQQVLNENFDRMLFWSTINFIFAYLFIISFIVHFYIFSFAQQFSVREEVMLNIILWLLGYAYYKFRKGQSRNVRFSFNVNKAL